jgi:hypothetical protein
MNARNDIKTFSIVDLNAARFALAAAQLRLASWIDVLVARWLERRATDVVTAQRLFGFKTDPDAQT